MKFSNLNRFFTAAALAAVISTPVSAEAATDIFLKIDGVEGSSNDARHKGEIDVLSWSWGESKGTVQTRNGTLPVSCINDLTITKIMDKSTPHLIAGGAADTVFANVKLTMRSASNEMFDFFTITMSNVTISSYTTGGKDTDDRLTETVSLHFNSAHGQFVPQNADGSRGGAILWDVVEGAGRRGQTCP